MKEVNASLLQPKWEDRSWRVIEMVVYGQTVRYNNLTLIVGKLVKRDRRHFSSVPTPPPLHPAGQQTAQTPPQLAAGCATDSSYLCRGCNSAHPVVEISDPFTGKACDFGTAGPSKRSVSTTAVTALHTMDGLAKQADWLLICTHVSESSWSVSQ